MFGKRRSNRPIVPADVSGEPLTNAGVVEAMRNVSVDDRPDARAMLFQLLLETTLLAVTPSGPERSGERVAQPGEALNIVTLTDDDGTVMPVFTSVETLSRWLTEQAGYVALPSRTLFEMAAAGGTNKLAIDPGSPTWGVVTRYEIEQLARGRLPLGRAGDIVAKETTINVGKPAEPPTDEALTAIRSQFAIASSVTRAWYFLMQQGQLEPELFVGIEFDHDVDPTAGLMRTIIDGAGAACPDVRLLAFLAVDDSWRATLTGGSGELFYQRS